MLRRQLTWDPDYRATTCFLGWLASLYRFALTWNTAGRARRHTGYGAGLRPEVPSLSAGTADAQPAYRGSRRLCRGHCSNRTKTGQPPAVAGVGIDEALDRFRAEADALLVGTPGCPVPGGHAGSCR